MYDVIIMCGGEYKDFKQHKALSVIKGEVLVEHTIRLLEENGVKNWYISATDPSFEKYGNILKHKNSFKVEENGKITYRVTQKGNGGLIEAEVTVKDNTIIEIEIIDNPKPMELVPGGGEIAIGSIFGDMLPKKRKKRKLSVKEARKILKFNVLNEKN